MIVSACLFVVVLGCAVRDEPDGEVDLPHVVRVDAEVLRYIPHALHEDYEDGGFATFDAVEFKIASPPKWRGKKLRVYCTPGTKNPLFQSAGVTCRFEIEDKYLVGSTRDPATGVVTTFQPFDSALRDFRQVE